MSTPPRLEPPILPCDPGANYQAHRQEIERAIRRVLEGGRYILGPEVASFEEQFARYLGVPDVVGVASGTDALRLALTACGIGPGDAVVTVGHTAVATVAAIELAGATPVLVDIDPVTHTMDPAGLEEAIRAVAGGGLRRAGRLKAVVPVHLYGHPADMPSLMALAQRHSLYVIEDCAQAHGAVLRGRKAGAWGDAAAFSFYPTKNLGAVGDGGAVATADPALADRLRWLREYGWRQNRLSEVPGMNSRLDEIQAAVLRVKLRHLDAENARRRLLARLYDGCLEGTGLIVPRTRSDAECIYHQYVVRAARRDELRAYLHRRGIETLVHYPVPVHRQPAYQGRLPQVGSLVHTEAAARGVLSLPMYPEMPAQHVEAVGRAIRAERITLMAG